MICVFVSHSTLPFKYFSLTYLNAVGYWLLISGVGFFRVRKVA